MAETTTASTQAEPGKPIEQLQKHLRFPRWHQLLLGGIILISLFMNFFQLGENGFGSFYYAPAIKSMMSSWHNFFFAAYDPAGFVSIDKPPVGFWLQVISAKIFGFNALSLLLPQALAGVLSVLLLYYLVRRHFGVVAGLLAALALAISPVSIVTNRSITIDSTLTLALLIGAWAVFRAVETGKLRWLLLSAFLVAVGFNIKMLQAYLVVPAFVVLYLFTARLSIWKRIVHLVLAGLLLVTVSLSWVLAVDLTPASQRPYVGSTKDNSAISLALGYNGLNRLFGLGGNNAPPQPGGPQTQQPGGPQIQQPGDNKTPQPQPSTGGPNGLFDLGIPGPLRLFGVQLGSQIGWFLPLALLGMLALAWQRHPKYVQEDRKLQSLVFWGMWVLTMGIFFSVASFFHQYYMTVMAPGIAALVGAGLVTMWQDYRRGGWRGWLLPVALVATAAEQAFLLSDYPAWRWLIPLIAIFSLGAVGALVIARIAPLLPIKAFNARILGSVLSIGGLALVLTPTLWAILPMGTTTLLAGPPQATGGTISLMKNGKVTLGSTNLPPRTLDPALVRYLEANQGQATFLLAVPSSQEGTAGKIMLATDKPVMAMGGFSSNDPILTIGQLEELIKQGTIRFFLLPQAGMLMGGQGPFNDWVRQHCQTVPANLWQSSIPDKSPDNGPTSGGRDQLYDCATPN